MAFFKIQDGRRRNDEFYIKFNNFKTVRPICTKFGIDPDETSLAVKIGNQLPVLCACAIKTHVYEKWKLDPQEAARNKNQVVKA